MRLSEQQALLLALCKIKGGNWHVLAREAQRHGGIELLGRGEVTESSKEALDTREAIRASLSDLAKIKVTAQAEAEKAEEVGARLATVVEQRYPAHLPLIYNLPPFLFTC